jgi:hypothetical protein
MFSAKKHVSAATFWLNMTSQRPFGYDYELAAMFLPNMTLQRRFG